MRISYWSSDVCSSDLRAHRVRAVLHPPAVADLAGRGAAEAVPHRAALRADPAAAADPAAEDPAQHRGRGPPARPADRHLGGGAARPRAHPRRTLQPAATGRRVPQAPAGAEAPAPPKDT